MQIARRFLAIAVLGTLAGVGCNDASSEEDTTSTQLPVWEGQRVVLHTDLVDEVCVGTLTWLDSLVESIESELEFEDAEEKLEVYLLEPEEVEAKCGDGIEACAIIVSGRIYVSSNMLREAARHELVHARLMADEVVGIPFFNEGIASALSTYGGCLHTGVCPTADELDTWLAAAKSTDLFGTSAFTAGSDLVHGMLNTYGPAAVLGFIAELPSESPAEDVRAAYLEQFGATIDSDFEAFSRDVFDDYTMAQLDCDGLVPAPRGDDGRVEIHSTMECSSPEVVNQFPSSTRGTIAWTFTVTPEQSGAFEVSLGPADADVTLVLCRPPYFEWSDFADFGPHYRPSWTDSSSDAIAVLAPGQYRIEWPADFGASLDFELIPPCTFEAGDCPPGQQCTIWNECRTEVADPVSLGETCQQTEDGPLACEAGARCVGGTCVAECDATKTCEVGQACSRTRICGAICDLLAQDCALGFACVPSGEEELNANGLGVCLVVGDGELYGSCDRREEGGCRAGLSCELVTTFGGSPCSGEDGCCVPYCDATAAESGCPSDVPVCDSIRGGPIGVCHPMLGPPGGS